MLVISFEVYFSKAFQRNIIDKWNRFLSRLWLGEHNSITQNFMLKMVKFTRYKKLKPKFQKGIVDLVLFCCNPLNTNTCIYSAPGNLGCC